MLENRVKEGVKAESSLVNHVNTIKKEVETDTGIEVINGLFVLSTCVEKS
jgi:hypothetical protein